MGTERKYHSRARRAEGPTRRAESPGTRARHHLILSSLDELASQSGDALIDLTLTAFDRNTNGAYPFREAEDRAALRKLFAAVAAQPKVRR